MYEDMYNCWLVVKSVADSNIAVYLVTKMYSDGLYLPQISLLFYQVLKCSSCKLTIVMLCSIQNLNFWKLNLH